MNITRLRAEAASAIHAVRVALQVIAARTDGDRTITKGRLDIATGTDLKSQAVIREVLERAQPEHLFVGEESGCDRAPAVGSYWLVDPICGTRNYASGLPLYCVNVALVEHGRVVVAAVGDGPSGQVWVAEQGRGAWVDEGGNLVRISASEKSATVLLDPGRPGGPTAMRAATVIAAAIRDGRWELRTLGTSLDLAYLAAGRVAGVWHFSRIPPLHFAAGTLLAAEAGALVTDEQGRPWTLDSTSLVAAATTTLHDELLALLPAAVGSGQ